MQSLIRSAAGNPDLRVARYGAVREVAEVLIQHVDAEISVFQIIKFDRLPWPGEPAVELRQQSVNRVLRFGQDAILFIVTFDDCRSAPAILALGLKFELENSSLLWG